MNWVGALISRRLSLPASSVSPVLDLLELSSQPVALKCLVELTLSYWYVHATGGITVPTEHHFVICSLVLHLFLPAPLLWNSRLPGPGSRAAHDNVCGSQALAVHLCYTCYIAKEAGSSTRVLHMLHRCELNPTAFTVMSEH